MDLAKIHEWKLAFLPSLNNNFNQKVRKMNKYGKLPFPYSYLASLYKEIIKERYLKIDKVDFNYDFFCLFGNLHGESVWFTNTYILDYAPLFFGKNITIGPDVKLITSWHEIENFNIVRAAPIYIEDNVWITMNVIVLPGVRIGKNSIVAAGSIVTKDVPPDSLVGGNPATVIKSIDRNFNYWGDLEKDIVDRNAIIKKNIYISLLRLPIKLLNKVLKLILKKIL